MSEDAYIRGYADQGKGLTFLDNPFDSYSDEGRHWIDGYVKAMQDQRSTPAHCGVLMRDAHGSYADIHADGSEITPLAGHMWYSPNKV